MNVAARYAEEKLKPLQDKHDSKERYEALITEKNDEFKGYQLLYPNGETEFVRYKRIKGKYEEGNIVDSNNIKPKHFVKKNKKGI